MPRREQAWPCRQDPVVSRLYEAKCQFAFMEVTEDFAQFILQIM